MEWNGDCGMLLNESQRLCNSRSTACRCPTPNPANRFNWSGPISRTFMFSSLTNHNHNREGPKVWRIAVIHGILELMDDDEANNHDLRERERHDDLFAADKALARLFEHGFIGQRTFDEIWGLLRRESAWNLEKERLR
jgi:hypothetical protein